MAADPLPIYLMAEAARADEVLATIREMSAEDMRRTLSLARMTAEACEQALRAANESMRQA